MAKLFRVVKYGPLKCRLLKNHMCFHFLLMMEWKLHGNCGIFEPLFPFISRGLSCEYS